MQGAPRARGGDGFAGISRLDGACMHSSLRAASGAVCRSGGQASHEWRFIKAPLGLSVLAGLAARHVTTSPPAASPLARRRPPQIQPAAPKRALHIGRSKVRCQHLRAPSQSVRAGAVHADRGRSAGGGGVRDGADLPLEGGPEVHVRCGAPPWPSPGRQSSAVHPFVAERLRRVPGGAEQQEPTLSGRSQGCCPPPQRRLRPTRPAPSPARPSAGQLKGSGLRQTIVTCRRSLRPGGSVCGQPRRVPGQAVCTCPGAGAGGLGGRSSPGAAAARQRRVPRRPRRQAHELRLPCAAVGIAATGRAGARFS